MRRLLIPTIIAALSIVTTATGQEGEVRSNVDEWRDTLLYGINSEIVDLIPTLTENREDALIDEILQVFESTQDSDVITQSVRYLESFEIEAGQTRAEAIVQDPFGRPDETLIAVMGYLATIEATLDEETNEAILEIIDDRRGAPATSGVGLLSATGYPTEKLIELYREGDMSDEVRGRILVELGNRDEPEVFTFIQEIITEDEEATTTLQRYAIDTLGKLGDERGLPTIIRQFDSDDAMTRAYATNALTAFDTPEANEALIGALRDEFWRVRVAALETIAERGMNDALPAVMYKARRDPERRVRLEAIETLAALDVAEGWELMEEMVLSTATGVEIRSAIIDKLLRERPRQSRDTVLQLVEREWDIPNSRILDVIGRVVSQTTDQSVEPFVSRLLDHPNFLIQIYAIRGIGTSQLMSLREIANDRAGERNHRAVRSAALQALDDLGVPYREAGTEESETTDGTDLDAELDAGSESE